MTKNEIIEKTLKEISPRLDEHDDSYSEDPDWEEIVIAELQERLPETAIKTCEDFRHLNVACCELCHELYPHYEMKLIKLPDGSPAWVCDAVERALFPERYRALKDWKQNSPEGELLRQIFGEDHEP